METWVLGVGMLLAIIMFMISNRDSPSHSSASSESNDKGLLVHIDPDIESVLTRGFKADIMTYVPQDEQEHWLGYVYELENDQMYSNSARTKAELEGILWDWRKNNWAEWHTWEDQED